MEQRRRDSLRGSTLGDQVRQWATGEYGQTVSEKGQASVGIGPSEECQDRKNCCHDPELVGSG